MVHRAFGRAFSPDEVEDVYANAWASTLAALRGRERSMSDDDLRSYLLTAVANHASKEMRRRSRKPAGTLDEVHAQVLSDPHQLSPDERATGSETGSQARDVLSSLPPRRRAVMLLRYGWGLEPKEVCRLIDGLSPRAYRKEITRGVEEMITRFRQLERGEWCESREPLIRDYVAGTADVEGRRQAIEHISHCRRCGELVNRLHEGLHELGGALAWTAVAGAIGERGPSLGDRLAALLDRGREGASALAPTTGETAAGATGSALAGGARGAGAAGAGLLAKLAGVGVAGKIALACIGVGASAAPASLPASCPAPRGRRGTTAAALASRSTRAGSRRNDLRRGRGGRGRGPRGANCRAARRDRAPRGAGGAQRRAREQAREKAEAAADGATAYAGAPAGSPAPTAPASEQEFGLPSAAATPSGSSGSGDGGATAGDVAAEFGP